ncbi:unnamed protein product [Malus baccata var. baccata]
MTFMRGLSRRMTFMRQGNHTVHAIPKKYVEMCTPKVCNGNCASSFHPPLCSSAQWKRNPFSGKVKAPFSMVTIGERLITLSYQDPMK